MKVLKLSFLFYFPHPKKKYNLFFRNVKGKEKGQGEKNGNLPPSLARARVARWCRCSAAMRDIRRVPSRLHCRAGLTAAGQDPVAG